MFEPLELSYDLQLLPPGRVGFRRWRWELWHGPLMLAAGWRLSELHAQRALRVMASRYSHRRHGVVALRPDVTRAPESAWSGRTVAVECGALRVVLVPRSADDQEARQVA